MKDGPGSLGVAGISGARHSRSPANRLLYKRDPTFLVWFGVVEDIAAHRKSRKQVVEEWQHSDPMPD
jgi:hypothetical protein